MHKIFKYLWGTLKGGAIPWQTNSGAISAYVANPDRMPNYKTLALASNIQTMPTYTPKLDRLLLESMIKKGSKPGVPPKPVETSPGITDNTPTAATGGTSGTTETPDAATGGVSKSAKVGNTMGLVVDIMSSIIPKKPQSELTGALDQGFDAASSVVMMANPLVGGIMKAGGLATDLMRMAGVGTDLVTTEDQILDSKFLSLTPIGLANSFGASKALTLKKGLDYQAIRADMGSGYGSAMDSLDTAEKYSGKKVGNIFGLGDRVNAKVNKANYRLAQLERIWDKSSINRAIQGTQSDMAFNKENLRMLGGWQDGAISFGRYGMIIEPARLRMIRHIAQSCKPKVYTEIESSEEEIVQFKNGGSFNVIPEGSLHARLHHMENAEGLTLKGIPVVVEKDGGELEQLAEIELNEIIFRLEVTNEIEKLMKDGSDNAAIECGKMLVKEIFENTQDRTGLIEALEEPKEDQGSVVKEHRVFQEGGKIGEDIKQRLIKEWPALGNIVFNIVPDSTFTSDKTGVGSIEYFAPDEEDEMSYPNGYKHKNPHKGEASIVYDPASNDYEDIKMDLLHALRVQDPKYRALVEELDNAVLNGNDDLSYNARLRYNEDYRKLGREYMPFKSYVSNEVDGLLRNLFYNASPEVLHKKRYYPNKEELRKWNEHLLPYIEKILKYLQGND